MFRYVAFAWDARVPERTIAVRDWEGRLQADGAWVSVLSAEGVRVWTAGATQDFTAHPLAEGSGVILGEIYGRQHDMQSDHAASRPVFGVRASLDVLATRGRRLISHYWGNYVAFLLVPDARETLVLKDPAGSLPCHVAALRGVHVFFSHLVDCLTLRAVQFHVNWCFVRSRIANSVFEVESNPWEEVSSVHRGECLTLNANGQRARDCFWHPRSFDGAEDLIEDPTVAAQSLRATVRSCVHTLAASHLRLLQQTSGGLDSSIVLGALGDAPCAPQVTCYTVYSDGAPSDERRWARLAASAGGHRHMEQAFEISKIDLESLPSLAPSVYPVSATVQWHRGPLERQLSAETGATAVFTGECGDAAFCATSYVFAVDHSFKRYGVSRRMLSTAVLVAARRDRTVWQVVGQTLRRRRWGSSIREYRQLMSGGRQLLHADARQESTHFPNPWFSADQTVDIESIWRLGSLAYAPQFYDLSISPGETAPRTISPLCAQPVYEVCRRIPVDLHFESGRIRGLARRAFEGQVPEPILKRQWKDRPVSQPAEIVHRNLRFIRELLLDGHLCQAHILDRAALEAALSGEMNRQPAVSSEILGHLDIELWLRDGGLRCA